LVSRRYIGTQRWVLARDITAWNRSSRATYRTIIKTRTNNQKSTGNGDVNKNYKDCLEVQKGRQTSFKISRMLRDLGELWKNGCIRVPG
jgi:hypothetical protein